MNDQDKAREQLIAELVELRQRVADQDAQLARGQRAEADQRQINNSLPVLVATAGVDGYYREVNAAFERILGWSEQESLSRPFMEFIHPDDRAAAVETFARLKSGDPAINFLDRNICKDGSHRWINWTVIPAPDRAIVFGIGQDVTEKEQAEAELHRSEAKWRSVVSNAPVFVAIVDEADTIQFLNRAASGMTVQDAIGKSVYDFIQPEFRETATSRIERVRRTGETAVYETLAAGPNGNLSWYETHVGPVKIDDKVVGMTLVSTDITERKRAEEAIGQSLQRMRLHVQQTPLAVIEWDLELRVATWNPGAVRVFGYTEEETLGRHFTFLVPSVAKEQVDRVWDALRVEKGGERSTNENITKDGKTILCEWYNTPLVNVEGQVIGFASLAQDLTEQKRVEAALRASEAKYRRLHQSMMDAFVSVSMDGQIQESNEAYRQMLGYGPEELLALRYTDLTPEKWHPFEAQMVQDKVLPRGYSDTYEKEYVRKDGTVFPVELRTFLIRDDERKPTGMWAIIRDITERKQAEKNLQDANRLLEQRVLDRTAELAQANARLKVEVEQRRQAEEAIGRSEAKYRALVESSPDAVAMLDLQGRIVFASQRAAEQLGLLHPDELVGLKATEFVVESDRSRLAASLRSLIEEGVHGSVEYRLLRRDGSTFDVEVSSAVIRDATGTPEALMGVYRDISDRKKAEKAIAESEEKYRHLVEMTDTGFLILDERGCVVDANDEYVRISGHHALPEILGRSVEEWTAPHDAERNAQEVNRCLEQGRVRGLDVEYVHADGTVIPIEINASVVETRHGRRIVSLCRDITERKHTEEALRDSEARLSFALEASRTGAWDLNLLDHTARRSLEHDRIFGYQSLLPSWTYEMFLEHVLPEDREVVDQKFRQAIDFQNDWSFECRICRSDGEIRWIWAAGCRRPDESGSPRRMAGIVQDITDQKKAEEAIRQSHDELQTIYDGIIEGLLITDIETKRFVRVNAAFCRMLGYSEEELLTKAIKDIHPAEEVSNDEQRFQAAADGRVSINEDRPVLRNDGSIFYADITGHRILYDERPCLLALFRDITERKQAEAKLKREQQALQRMVLASDHERHLITYELHDGVAQQLLGAKMLFESQRPSKGRTSKVTDAYQEGMEALHRASSEIRRVMNWLRTPVLDRFGLVDAIADVAAQLRLTPDAPEIEYHHAVQFERLERTLENTLFRIAQETMTNACRHSQSKKVRVKLTQKGDDVTLEVRDWGIGFDPDTIQENRFGLEGIRERCRVLGGKLSIKSQLGKGTVVQVKVPVLEATEEE